MEILHHSQREPAPGSLQPDLFAPLGDRPPPHSSHSLCDRLAAFLKARRGQWIDGRELALVAGAYVWRTRISDLRRPPYNLDIENRQRREGRCVISEYRLAAADSDDRRDFVGDGAS